MPSKLTRQYCRGGAARINRAVARVIRHATVALALGGVSLSLGCNGGEDGAAGKKAGGGGAAEPEAVVVAVLPAKADRVQRSVEVIGTLFGQEDTHISNKIPGRVTGIFVDVGDRVAPGQALAQLLKNDYQLSLDEKQALLDEALASLGVTEVPGEDFDVEAVPAVRRARLQARNAESKFERARQLHESRPPLISDQDFADLETESQVARSAYEAAVLEARTVVRTARTRQAQVAIAEQVMRDTTIRAPRPFLPDGSGPLNPTTAPAAGRPIAAAARPTAGASGAAAVPAAGTNRDVGARIETDAGADADAVAAGEAGVDAETARTDADADTEAGVDAGAHASVDAEDADTDGDGPDPASASDADRPYVVAARYSSEGELNAGLTRMFRLVIDDPLKMRANVPERHAGQIKVGQKVVVRVESEHEPSAGVVARINPQIDPANRTFEVEVAVPNPRHVLKPGAFARAEIQTFVQPDVLLVPERSVVSFAGVKKVFSVKDGKAVEIPVSTGTRVGDWVEVTKAKDLTAGVPVVVDGVNRMSAGVPVTVREAAASAAATSSAGSPTTRVAADGGPSR